MASIIDNRNLFNDYFGLCCKCCRTKRLADVNHNQFLLLKEINTDLQLRGLLATIQATLVYQNSFETPVEVEYRMPLQSTDVITDLTVTFSGKQVKAVVKEKEEAKDDYDDAIASGRQAVFAVQDTKDIFNILFGNLPPGASAEVRLTLVQELLVTEEEAIRFILPTTLKPRYRLATDSTLQAALVPTSSTSSAQQYVAFTNNKYAFSFTMNAEFPGGFKKVESPSHHLSSEQLRDDIILLRLLEEKTSLDLVILLFPDSISIPIALLEDALPHPASSTGGAGTSSKKQQVHKHSSKKQQVHTYCTSRAFTINFIPSFPANSDCPCEFIFVIDRSGSMSGSPIQNAKNTLELMLRSLEPGCYFNIVGFGSSFTFLYPESVEYTQKNLEHASKETQAMNANLGGTEVMEPLNAIYNTKKHKGLPRQIFLLTDGSVSNIDSVVQVVKNHSGEARVFGIGIGSGVSTELVNGISEAGRGRAVFVSESERMQSKILKLMSDAISPCCTDIKLSYNKSKMCIFPQNLPQLFSEERLVVYGFLLGAAAADTSEHIVTLEYSQNKAMHLHEVKLSAFVKGGDAEKSSSQLIHKLACRAALNELENVSNKLEECILLSCSMGVVCKLTAMVAVDVTEGSVVEGSLQLYKVPDQYPHLPNLHKLRFGAQPASINNLQLDSAIFSSSSDPNFEMKSILGSKYNTRLETGEDFFGLKDYAPPAPPKASPPFMYFSVLSPPSTTIQSVPGSIDSCAPPLPPRRSPALSPPLPGSISSVTSPPPPASPSGFSHESIAKLQSALGYWESSPQLLNLLSLSNKQLDMCPIGIDAKLWITLLVVAILEKKYATYNDEWFLVVKKARKWTLSCKLPQSITLKELTEMVQKVLE